MAMALDEMQYVDRFISLEQIELESEADYNQCNFWKSPLMLNANTLFYITGGQWQAMVEGAEYTLSPQELCIIKPMEACMIQPLQYPCSMWRCSFSLFYFRVFDPELILCRPFIECPFGVGNLVKPSQYKHEVFQTYLERVIAQQTPWEKRLGLVVMLATLLYDLKESFDFHVPDTRPQEIRNILNYINEQYCEDIEMATLTRSLYLSRSQLAKIIKKYTGFTTWDYVLNKRVLRAQQLIHGGMSNRDVAQAVGFRDYSTFNKAFLRIIHATPGDEMLGNQDPTLKHFYDINAAKGWANYVSEKRNTGGR